MSSSFVLAYHGCDERVGEALLKGQSFKQSQNEYDWLGPGAYFWESNPARGLQFAEEASKRRSSKISKAFVVGAIVDLGSCLDLTTLAGVRQLQLAFASLKASSELSGMQLPENSEDLLRRYLDCAVIQRLHEIRESNGLLGADTVKGIFTEGLPAYAGSAFREKTHVQIAVRNLDCIKGVFRVTSNLLVD